MKQGKIGAPYKCTESQANFLAGRYVGFDVIYQTVQGVCRGLSDVVRIPEIHFTQIRRRILKLQQKIGNLNLEDPFDLIFDSLGLSTTSMEHKWKKQRQEYVKLYISVDVKSKKIVLYKVTHGNSSATKQFVPLFQAAKNTTRR